MLIANDHWCVINNSILFPEKDEREKAQAVVLQLGMYCNGSDT